MNYTNNLNYFEMYDFIKFISNDIDDKALSKNPLLKFKGEYYHNNFEIPTNTVRATYKGMVFIIYETGTVKIQGSIHKYYNQIKGINAPNQLSSIEREKGFNGNDFGLEEIIFVINDFQQKFNINLLSLKLINVEVGVNIINQYNNQKVLTNIMNHRKKPFSIEIGNNIHYKYCKHSQFIVKCYDKSLQYGMNQSVIRFEIKFTKMEKLNKRGLFVFNDFLNPSNIKILEKILIDTWNEILMFDFSIDRRALNKKDKIKMKDYENPTYWIKIESNRLDRPKKHLKKIVNKHSEKIHEAIAQSIKDKWKTLSTCVTNDQDKKLKHV